MKEDSNLSKEELSKKYGLFNGRRNADEYVKGYLKGIALISGTGLTVFTAVISYLFIQGVNVDKRVTTLEASKFTIQDGQKLNDMINKNTISFTKAESLMNSISKDLDEIKNLLRRSAPQERQNERNRI